MNNIATLVAVLVMFVVAGLLVYLLFKFYNSPDGERYRKREMQGPFVPLSEADLAEDEARIRVRRK
jgi:heme/copper-type cytochrome/quinol oxidase subunit 2